MIDNIGVQEVTGQKTSICKVGSYVMPMASKWYIICLSCCTNMSQAMNDSLERERERWEEGGGEIGDCLESIDGWGDSCHIISLQLQESYSIVPYL